MRSDEPSVRRLRHVDLPDLRAGFNRGAIAETTRYVLPLSAEAERQRMRAGGTYRFAIRSGDTLVGISTLRPPLYSGMELTIGIFDARYQGRGIGTYTVRKTCDFGFRRLRLSRIELGVYPCNTRAHSCYRRCGFKEEALLRDFLYNGGVFCDVIWMSLLRSEWEASQD